MKPYLRTFAVVVIASMAIVVWASSPYLFVPSGTSTISLWYAAETFHQCSRDAPAAQGPYWLPVASEIDEIERELETLLIRREDEALRVPKKFLQYHRQYIGFVRNKERLIYVNFSPNIDYYHRDWSLLERPVSICDGGSGYWGIVYNPQTKQFEEPDFNGVA